MKNIITILLFLQLFSDVHSTLLPEFNDALLEIQNLAHDTDDQYKIAIMIEMKMKQTDRFDEVVDMLNKMKDQLQSELNDMNMRYSKTSAFQKETISTLQNNFERLSSQLRISNQAHEDVNTDLASLLQTYHSLKSQLQVLDGKEQVLRDDYSDGELEHNRVQGSNLSMRKALTTIIDMLTQAVFTQRGSQVVLSQLEQQQIILNLIEQLGPDNPVVQLVQVTTKFDEGTVIRIIERLEQLRDSINENLDNQEDHHTKSVTNYNTVISQVNDIRRSFAKDYEQTLTKIRKLASERSLIERNKQQLSEDLNTCGNALSLNRIQEENAAAYHEINRGDLVRQLRMVTRAINVINRCILTRRDPKN